MRVRLRTIVQVGILLIALVAVIAGLLFSLQKHPGPKPTPTPKPRASEIPQNPTPTVPYAPPTCQVQGHENPNAGQFVWLELQTTNKNDSHIIDDVLKPTVGIRVRGRILQFVVKIASLLPKDPLSCLYIYAQWGSGKPVLVSYQNFSLQPAQGFAAARPRAIDLDAPVLTSSSGTPNPPIPLNTSVQFTFAFSTQNGEVFSSNDTTPRSIVELTRIV